MVKLAGALSHFQPIHAIVIGDYMLDTYTTGRVKRISPEAPVPVMEILRQESRPGGAGNVVLNLTALGAKVSAFGRIGRDPEGEILQSFLSKQTVDLSGLLIEDDYRTGVKNRLIADSQQLLRVDLETIRPISSAFAEKVLKELRFAISDAKIVALSDYGKGFLTRELIAEIIAIAKKKKVPVIVDPKGIDFAKYNGATILKPNLSEAYAAAQLPYDASLDQVAERIRDQIDVKYLLITKSEAGMSLFDKKGCRQDFFVPPHEVKDGTGAGDTVLAMISAAMANRLSISIAIELANIAAGITIERLGCAQVTISEIAHRLLEFDSDSKIFDDSHMFALKEVLKDQKYFLLVLSKDQEVSPTLFRTLRNLKEKEVLIVYVQNAKPQDDLIHFLSSMQEVDYIILQHVSLQALSDAIRPKKVYFHEGNQLKVVQRPKEMLILLKLLQRGAVFSSQKTLIHSGK